ncbi:MAG: Gfo/Idh/MocA family oxidoreductase [Clostridiales bacterium]|jgi:predicted dehydrogenase|nr:Gfo/Idh/MocA family oxidoreductase [Clostridiales bacterium]
MGLKKTKVALIGAGGISYTYLQNMVDVFAILEVEGCADAVPERRARAASLFGIREMTNEEIMGDPEIEIVVNTTFPSMHYEITEQALNAGKHVYTEKMMATDFESAKKLHELARQKGLRIACAPDTFLSGPYQTARKLIDDGYIGEPICAVATVVRGYRNDQAQPIPRPGGLWAFGSALPMDMGGYYSHALVHLLGPIARISGFAATRSQEFTNPKNEYYGQTISADAPTSEVTALEFCSGAIGTLIAVGDSHDAKSSIEVHGTEGSLLCPDPNTFSGPLYLHRRNCKAPMEVPLTHDFNQYAKGDAPEWDERRKSIDQWKESRRGIGVADLAWAIANGRPHRCSAELGLHAMEIVYGTGVSAEQNAVYRMTTRPAQPQAIPPFFIGGAAEKSLDTN